MIMPIAIAKDGFVDINTIGFSISQNYDFEETLKLIFNFEDKDLQFFDGNTCRLINAYDPTNSIFIYENQQGKFLYKITSASPVIHKNNFIWLCNCYKMEDISFINKVLTQKQTNEDYFGVVASIQKNIAHSNIDPVFASGGNVANKYLYKIEVKNNFETNAIDRFYIGADSVIATDQNFTLKIKCLVNPTTENLKSTSKDGSFNFLFPIKVGRTTTIGELPTISSKITNGTITISIADVISKYSENIKSIELLPFNCANIDFGTSKFSFIETSSDLLTIETLSATTIFTDCGIFVEQGFTNFFDLIYINKLDYPKQIVFGGGVRGFVQTPVGNIQLDFSTIYYDDFEKIVCIVKEDGFKIDGIGKAEIPPMYLNFYTDNAGQVFIQNLTTNAQELRQLEREKIAKQQEEQQQFVQGTLKSGFGVLQNLASGNIGGAIGNLIGVGGGIVESEFNKAKIERDYTRSLTEYNDKIKTQSLLASLTGKQISGNYSIIDFLISLNSFPFLILLEKNYYRQPIISNDNMDETGVYIVQQNYDYSTNAVIENLPSKYKTQVRLIIGNESFTLPNDKHCWDDITRFIINIFAGSPTENGVDIPPTFTDNIGLNFTIQFKLSNFINSTNFTWEDLKNQKETQVLNFQVRTHKKR